MNKVILGIFLSMLALPVIAGDLCDHIELDPDTRDFTNMAAEAIRDDLMGDGPDGDYKTQVVTTLNGREFFSHVVVAELRLKSDMDQLMILTLASHDDIDPFGPAASLVTSIFGPSATLTALAAARYKAEAPNIYYKLGTVKIGHVEACQ